MTNVANVTQIKYTVAVDNGFAIFPQIAQTRGEFVQVHHLGPFLTPCGDCAHIVARDVIVL